ncbi:MAG: error-prone DNA polymerase [Acidimicrobiia bacterium]|nr:MAG: error-prone DNA polymerase [Acidimicrobiia bacterium]
MFDYHDVMARYAELHCHTNYSFLDGSSWAGELVARAEELGYEALGVTDHDGFRGAVQVHAHASAVGFPIVYGTEVGMPHEESERTESSVAGVMAPSDSKIPETGEGDLTRRGRIKQMHGSKSTERVSTDHLVLLAPDPAGYAAVGRFVTRGQFRGEKDAPKYSYRDLAEAATDGGLVALSGCWQGSVPRAAQQGDLPGALLRAGKLKQVFGDRFYLELTHHGMPGDDRRNDILAEVGMRLGIETVATNNVHYAYRHDADLSEVLAAIGGRSNLDEADAFRPATDLRHLRTPDEMSRCFARYPGAVERAADLGRALAFDLDLLAPELPDFPMPGAFTTEDDYLSDLVYEGAAGVYPGSEDGIDPRARRRLEHELGVIRDLGFAGYFLVAWDIVQFARSRGIYCQIRGSGADSAVCRCIELTRVDPIRLGLPFERFLSHERGRPPDIDIDFEAERREEIIQYCYRRYGRERAAMVANVITYRARSVLQDVGKAFGLTQAQVNGLTKYVDTHDPKVLRDVVELPRGLTAEHIYDICHRLDGFPRHLGIHSGGMVVARRALWETVPMEWGRMQDRSVIQWDKTDAATMGIVKFDLLALGALNALHLSVDTISDVHGIDIDLGTIPQEPVIYEMLTRADTVGVFQVESRAQMATLPRMKPRTFYDLAVEVALIRPGPIQGQSVHPYLRRRNGEEPVSYVHPAAEPILAKTLGVPIFQEQLMEIARVCAGFTPGQSDRLRQAMTHKRSAEEMAKLEGEVFAGMAMNGITGASADELWEKLQGFASFGFPESHSVSFAYIVYAASWLKYHWPAEFFAGLLNAQPMGFYSPNSLVADALHHGVMVLPPDVNHSNHDCTVEPHDADPRDLAEYLGMSWRRGMGAADDPVRQSVALRLGLRYVRNLGDADIIRIEAARLTAGSFVTPEDFAQRTGLSVDAHEGLAGAGAMGSLGLGKRDGMWVSGTLAGLGPDRLALEDRSSSPQLPAMDGPSQMQSDLWSTGISVVHPVSFIRENLRAQGVVAIADALALRSHNSRIKVGGVVTHRQRPETANGVRFINLEDETGIMNVVMMPVVWEQNYEIARKAIGIVVEGVLEYRDGVTNLVARRLCEWQAPEISSRDFR